MPSTVHVRVYVDGFNFYYGCARRLGIKWIDILRLCELSLPSHYQIEYIRYFTAIVGDPNAAARHHIYLRALRTLPNFEAHFGTFLVNPKELPLQTAKPAVTHVEVVTTNGPQTLPLATPIPEQKTAVVIKSEEKGSDVNLASYLLLDAFNNAFDKAVVISDDSDLAEPIRITRKTFHRDVIVLSPRNQYSLRSAATKFWAIQSPNVVASTFPAVMTDALGTFHKPASW